MSAAAAEVEWFDEPLEVTPEREQRLQDWVVAYVLKLRDTWAAEGADVTTPDAIGTLKMVAYSMFVPERETWMPLGRALWCQFEMQMLPSAKAADPDDPVNLQYRDALRTMKSATEDELDWALGHQLGVSTDVARQRRTKAVDPDAKSGRTALYRHRDADGALLYIGIARDPHIRHEQHRRSSNWAALSDSMTVEWFATRAEAEAAERQAITDERPLFNTTHAGRAAKERAINYLFARMAL